MSEAAFAPAIATMPSTSEMMAAFVVPLQPGETIHSVSFEEYDARMEQQIAPLAERMRAVAATATEPLITYAVYDSELSLEDFGFAPEGPKVKPTSSLDFLKYALAKPIFEGNRQEYDGFVAMQAEQQRIIDQAAAERAAMETKEGKSSTSGRRKSTAGSFLGALISGFNPAFAES